MTAKQINKIVRLVLKEIGYCDHSQYADCGRCVSRWIRNAIKKTMDGVK